MEKTDAPPAADVLAAFLREPEAGTEAVKPAPSRTANLLIDVELPIRILFGRTRLRLREVLALKNGTVIELNQDAGEPVEILVNNRAIARGEVVVVEGNYGVRITEIMKQSDRPAVQDLSPDLLRLAEGVV